MKITRFWSLLLILFFCLILSSPVWAQSRVSSVPEFTEATQAAEATASALKAVENKPEVVEKKEDITESTSEVKGKLERYLQGRPIGPLTITNFLQHSIRQMVQKGVAANTIVLILLFPLVAAVIAGSRHVVGIRGFGIFLPAVLSVVFVATGIVQGLILFLTIILVASGSRMFLRKLKLEYLPRMSLLLWLVAMAVLLLMFASPFLNLGTISNLSIFPILILILLAENFISIQIGMSQKQAVGMTVQTLIMALICSLMLQLDFLQKFVLRQPEIYVISVALLDVFMGKYTGLRWLEYKKFKEILN
jgi:hypothetical protein